MSLYIPERQELRCVNKPQTWYPAKCCAAAHEMFALLDPRIG